MATQTISLDAIDLLTARLTQAGAILNLLTPAEDGPLDDVHPSVRESLWAVKTLLDQAHAAITAA
jgi:hypothetical protein